MRKTISFLALLIFINCQAQTTTINISEGSRTSSSTGTYIKDINNVFSPYLGIWKYQNGNEILTIKLEKVTKYYDPKFKTYFDFIKGNYSYTIDGGYTYLVNTIQTNQNINNPDGNPIYSSNPTFSPDIFGFNFILKDIIYNKSCNASFQFLLNSTTQMNFKLQPARHFQNIDGQPMEPDYSIPNNIILIKQ